MFTRRKSYNPKRAIASSVADGDLEHWTLDARYGGNPEHKKNPGDFGLTPPSNPRPNKTLCDGANILNRATAIKLLKEGIRRGLVSKQQRNGYPQNIWSVTDEGIPVEAQLENAETCTYHGYPMANDDPFREKILAKWRSVR